MELGIKGKKALVTGGATGIGKAIAIELVKEGVNVAITSRDIKKAQKTQLELDEILPGNYSYACNIVDEDAPAKLMENIISNFGDLDIIVNNVGHTLDILDPCCPIEDWRRLFRLIIEVPVEINNIALKYMRKQAWGRIVNITAGAGMENSGPVTYSSLKAAFTAYSRSMGRVLALENKNIVMSAVLPGVVLTEEGHWSEVLKTNPEHAEKYLEERTVLKRFGTPDEVSPMVALLCSELASFCVGSIVPVEGGQARHFFQKVDDN